MDDRLKAIAKTNLKCKFIRVNAEKAVFFSRKLGISVLPTLVIFKDGVAVDRIIGFEDLGGKDDFTTSSLERLLFKSGAIKKISAPTPRAHDSEEDD